MNETAVVKFASNAVLVQPPKVAWRDPLCGMLYSCQDICLDRMVSQCASQGINQERMANIHK